MIAKEIIIKLIDKGIIDGEMAGELISEVVKKDNYYQYWGRSIPFTGDNNLSEPYYKPYYITTTNSIPNEDNNSIKNIDTILNDLKTKYNL